MRPDLVISARELLANSKEPLARIARGSGVSIRWLFMFKKGEVANPTMRTVQGLHSYLTAGAASRTRSGARSTVIRKAAE